MISISALLLAAVIDPCAAPPAPKSGDRQQASVYLNIADEELAAGASETATVAYREVLRRDPTNGRARAVLATLCRQSRTPQETRPDLFAQGLALLKQGQRRQAAALFESVRAERHDSAAALLEGICFYELGEEVRAKPYLQEAAHDPSLAQSAQLFLGLVALRQGDGVAAAEVFGAIAASDDPRLRQTASELFRLAVRDGRASLAFSFEGGFDSNVALTPDGSPTAPNSRDGSAAPSVGLWVRPWGRSGPFARLGGQYRKQFRLALYDMGWAGGAAGWRVGKTRQTASVEYGYDFLSLGDAPYLSAHRLLADARLTRGPVVVSGLYYVRLESFLQSETSGYSGVHQFAELLIGLQSAGGASIACGYHGAYDGTRDRWVAFREHGPLCEGHLALLGRVRLMANVGLSLRDYLAADPVLVTQRKDTYYDGLFAAEIDVSDRWTVRLTATGRQASSNTPAYTYRKFTAALGAAYSFAAF